MAQFSSYPWLNIRSKKWQQDELFCRPPFYHSEYVIWPWATLYIVYMHYMYCIATVCNIWNLFYRVQHSMLLQRSAIVWPHLIICICVWRLCCILQFVIGIVVVALYCFSGNSDLKRWITQIDIAKKKCECSDAFIVIVFVRFVDKTYQNQ